VLLLAVVARAPAAERVDFTRDVRPILAENCFACHGPDEKQRKAKLRLDTRDGASQVITAGKPADSELIARITAEDSSKLMPPPKSGKSLKAHQKELLKKWIEQGEPTPATGPSWRRADPRCQRSEARSQRSETPSTPSSARNDKRRGCPGRRRRIASRCCAGSAST
jgi:hypothetical protein